MGGVDLLIWWQKVIQTGVILLKYRRQRMAINTYIIYSQNTSNDKKLSWLAFRQLIIEDLAEITFSTEENLLNKMSVIFETKLAWGNYQVGERKIARFVAISMEWVGVRERKQCVIGVEKVSIKIVMIIIFAVKIKIIVESIYSN